MQGEPRTPSALRATRAYITSFGTTGLLIASALLSLAVMSAFVAFNGFPGQQVQDPIGTLLVPQGQTKVNVAPKPIRVQVKGTTRAAATGTARHTSARHVQAPRASTGPVLQRNAPGSSTPTQGQTPTSSGQSPTTSVAGSTPTTPISTTTPQLPSTDITLPTVTLPSLPTSPPPPPGGSQQQLPIDTSGITGILGGQ
jgi:hypothetical protein